MSQSGSSCTPSPDIEKMGVERRTKDDSSSADSSVRKRVLKKVGLTSTSFIGPEFPPKSTSVKPQDIEDTLSEFYKELEQLDTPDGAADNSGKQNEKFVPPPETLKVVDAGKYAETDGHQRGGGQKQPWPHWYQNEPYYPRRPRPAAPSQSPWRHPQTLNRPPNPRFHRPPFHRPPPPSAFPNQHVNPNWSGSGDTNHYQEDFQTFSSFPPPNVCSPPSQDFYGGSPLPHFDRDDRALGPHFDRDDRALGPHFDKDDRALGYDAHSDNLSVGWSRDRKEESHQFGEDCDYRFDPENEPWEHHCGPPANTNAHHSSLVLIMMRGLPGSGKSTLARELLSSGPSGLILSTDDYFLQRDGYHYEAGLLGAAHEWNQNRAKDAMHDRRSPIIIDNTNAQAWEMKPYVRMALERGYKVDFCEPNTSWKFDPYELEKRNKHGVPHEKIAQMMDRFSFPISVDIVMSSQEPPHVNQRRRPEQVQTTMMRRNRDFH